MHISVAKFTFSVLRRLCQIFDWILNTSSSMISIRCSFFCNAVMKSVSWQGNNNYWYFYLSFWIQDKIREEKKIHSNVSLLNSILTRNFIIFESITVFAMVNWLLFKRSINYIVGLKTFCNFALSSLFIKGQGYNFIYSEKPH